uniref:Cytochrome P450 4F4-like n=1 Tax=Phallusia mammillata TaxID=59560 RepID=A0A6F9D9V3_9ASCI|nr:cytochrome P450 4F4-like [Phallusia mammillata]
MSPPPAAADISSSQFVLGYVFAYLLPVLVFSTVIVKYVKPFVQNQVRLRRTAKLLSCDDDAHWLYGHLKKVPLYTYEGLLQMAGMLTSYPVYFGYWMGPFNFVLNVYHPDVLKTILSKSSPKAPGYQRIIAPLFGDGLIANSGETWKRHRRLLTPIFHFNILQQHCEVFNSNCQPVIDWCEEVAISGKAEDISVMLSEASYRNMMECIMSQVPDVGKGEDYNQLVREAFQIVLRRWFNPFYHSDYIYKMTKDGKRFFEITGRIHAKVAEVKRLFCDQIRVV